jgi:hypothetical protein
LCICMSPMLFSMKMYEISIYFISSFLPFKRKSILNQKIVKIHVKKMDPSMSYIQTILRPPNMSDHTVHAIEGITSGEYPSSQQSFNPGRNHLNNENDMMSEFHFR